MSTSMNILTEDNKIYNMDVVMFSERSSFIKDMFEENIKENNFETEDPIPISVSYDILSLIEKYLVHHRGENIPLIKRPLSQNCLHVDDNISVWDKQFIESLSRDEIYNLVLACNYMIIDSLKDLCCARIALQIKPNIDNIETYYNVEGGISDEQKRKIFTEVNWA